MIIIVGMQTVEGQPREEAFDNPALGQDFEARIGAFNDPDGKAEHAPFTYNMLISPEAKQ